MDCLLLLAISYSYDGWVLPYDYVTPVEQQKWEDIVISKEITKSARFEVRKKDAYKKTVTCDVSEYKFWD